LPLNQARQLIWAGDFQTARYVLRDILHQENSPEPLTIAERIEAINLMSVLHISQGQFEPSKHVLQQGLNAVVGVEHLKTKLLANLGSTLYYASHFSEAIPILDEGYRIAQQYEDFMVMAFILSVRGNIAAEQVQFSLARQFYQQALHHAQRVEAHERQAFLHLNLGILSYYENRYDLAQIQYTKVEHYLKESITFNTLLLNHLRWNQGTLSQVTNGEHKPKLLQDLIHNTEIQNLAWFRIGVGIDEGIWYLRLGRRDRAIKQFEQLTLESAQIQHPDFTLRALYGFVWASKDNNPYSYEHEVQALLRDIAKTIVTTQPEWARNKI